MPNTGDRVSEYVLEEQVGRGTFGQVWRARHHIWESQRVAVKIPTDPQYVRALQREGTAIHGLVHPNIVRAIGFDPYAAPPYLIMEYVDGTSLRPLITRAGGGPALSIEDAVAILRQVLAGLGYAHQQGMVHRDVKPENVLIAREAQSHVQRYSGPGLVKVTDFGLGQRTLTASVNSIVFSASIGDASPEVAGSLEYMAPEQRTGADVDGRADLYACGVMLFELLTGERPAGTDVPSDLNRDVPRALDEAFRRSYARLEKRFANAAEFDAALARALADHRARGGSPDPRYREGVVGRIGHGGAAMPGPGAPGPGIDSDAGRPPTLIPPMPASTTDNGRRCARCRGSIDAGDQFCMHCGAQLVATVRRCGSCGAYPHPSDKFCLICGNGLPG